MNPSHAATPDPIDRGPLVVKGAERLNALVGPDFGTQQTVTMFSPAVCRLMRRDFNLTSVRLYWMDAASRAKLAQPLQALMKEAESLQDMVALDAFGPAFPVAVCKMRIVSEEAKVLFDALVIADLAHAKMLQGPLSEVSDVYMGRFFRSYGHFRCQVFGYIRGSSNAIRD